MKTELQQTIEENILQIINNHITHCPMWRRKQTAKIIASYMGNYYDKAFIEWTQEEGWSKYKNLDWWVKKDKKIPPKNPPLTLSELYQYWKDNIKK